MLFGDPHEDAAVAADELGINRKPTVQAQEQRMPQKEDKSK
jgi:hypothetical protein